VALAAAGADTILAVEFDRSLMPALREATEPWANVALLDADAMRMDWTETLGAGAHGWTLCANLPYNISVPLVLTLLESVPAITRFVVMVQREVGERLVADPDREGYGAVSVRVAYRAVAKLVRRVPPSVFWPRPAVASVVVRLDRLSAPPVAVEESRLWSVVDAGFAQRRKTMRNALRRLGLSVSEADAVLAAAGVSPSARAEELSLATFAAVAEQMPA
jgi:16S rRNA (adenine1518-N6/adenine1519-N6)-dimethyltransferase